MNRRRLAAAGLLLALPALPGCLERTITVTSEPPGAVVWLNNTEVGRTPLTTGFTFYGDYDVRLRKEGYEPIVTHREAKAPIYEQAPLDLVATALPMRIRTNRTWHFELEPLPPISEEHRGELVERARAMKDSVRP